VRRVLAVIVGIAAIVSVALNFHPLFVEEPPELWHEMHNVREALVGAGDQVCLPTGDLRATESFASNRYLAEWRARFGLTALGLLAGALAITVLASRERHDRPI